jgi:hypothetical protein
VLEEVEGVGGVLLVGGVSGSSWLVLAAPSRDSTPRLLEAAVTAGRLLTWRKAGMAHGGEARHPEAAYGLSCAMLLVLQVATRMLSLTYPVCV